MSDFQGSLGSLGENTKRQSDILTFKAHCFLVRLFDVSVHKHLTLLEYFATQWTHYFRRRFARNSMSASETLLFFPGHLRSP